MFICGKFDRTVANPGIIQAERAGNPADACKFFTGVCKVEQAEGALAGVQTGVIHIYSRYF